ncbi:MAG: hypothetical protein JRI23_18695, partial [Deltaproteobacteria bacterium]|nr:hypothetical protein [Deltaproteobacteria bacterium]MBW2533892.1 hypothetical protein [Deltaproteobacteria bacterium]
MAELVPTERWPEAVFHVLAHVEGTAQLPASVFDPRYVDFVAQAVGPAADRPLGEDAGVLAASLPTHGELASAQLLAWLFATTDQAEACAERDLATLGPEDVAEPTLLQPLASLGP